LLENAINRQKQENAVLKEISVQQQQQQNTPNLQENSSNQLPKSSGRSLKKVVGQDLDGDREVRTSISVPETDRSENSEKRARVSGLEGDLKDGKGAGESRLALPKGKEGNSAEELQLVVSVLASTFSCFKVTLPLYASCGSVEEEGATTPKCVRDVREFSPSKQEGSNFETLSVLGDKHQKQSSEVNVRFGELLYPSFNTLLPKMVESLPLVTKSRLRQQCVLVEVLYDLIAFTFKHRIIDDKITLLTTVNRPETSNDVTVSPFSTQISPSKSTFGGSFNQVSPSNLMFKPTTEWWKKRLAAARTGATSSKTQDLLPLFRIFSNLAVHSVATSQLEQIVRPEKPAVPNRQKNDGNVSKRRTTRTAGIGFKSRQTPTKTVTTIEDDLEKDRISPELAQEVTKTKVFALLSAVMITDSVTSLKTLLTDLMDLMSGENSEYVKELLVKSFSPDKFVYLLQVPECINLAMGVLLHLCGEGEHQKLFFAQLADLSVLKMLINIGIKYNEDNEISEDLIVLLQKMSSYNLIQEEDVDFQYIKDLGDKLALLEEVEDSFFLVGNIRSFLRNIAEPRAD